MKLNVNVRRGYAVQIQPRPSGFDWMVTDRNGRTANGQAPDPASADLCCDFTIAMLEALQRVGQRRF
jgi:hypothetical protein